MTVGGRFLARLVTILVALVGLVMVGASPAVAESNTVAGQYVALGDSYAAGQGGVPVGEYLDPTCLVSPNGYPYLLDAEKGIHLQSNAACTGASTDEVANEQLSSLNRSTRLVTLTVGAADLNLSEVLAACTAVPPTPTDCQAAINRALLLLVAPPGGESVLGGRLTDLFEMVAAAAPKAKIVVTGYPYLFNQPVACNPLPTDVIGQINCATAALNSTIQQAVLTAQASGINIVYVDVTEDFAGHGIGSADPYINSTGIGAYHPNAAGYVAYAEAISTELQSAR
jgi:lysophospholipase L1-like esterase